MLHYKENKRSFSDEAHKLVLSLKDKGFTIMMSEGSSFREYFALRGSKHLAIQIINHRGEIKVWQCLPFKGAFSPSTKSIFFVAESFDETYTDRLEEFKKFLSNAEPLDNPNGEDLERMISLKKHHYKKV